MKNYKTQYRKMYGGIQMSELKEILYLIFDYPHKHCTFKHFEVQQSTHFTTNLPRLNEPLYDTKIDMGDSTNICVSPVFHSCNMIISL